MKEINLVNDLPLNDQNASSKPDLQYKVLARKYRPRTFEDLIGQNSMVKILSNAFSLNRIAHAFLFTGVRGVGKTTAARIVARGLNCLKDDSPTISPCGVCSSCISAKNDRHVDIVEIDAASHTGVDDVRELTEGVRYKPAEGRYKIYIIDEVHMLSTQAFNALLKTLEEPPEHVKFIFCTTEIKKIPVTVLSRCQKFDLRRVAVDELVELLRSICSKEEVSIDDKSLNLLARYSDGSVRDSLSLLDQAISMSNTGITLETINNMLGLSDKSIVWDLFDKLIQGDILSVLNHYDNLLKSGSDPVLIMEELLQISHNVARAKAVPSLNTAQVMSEYETNRALKSAELTNIPSVARCWQLLLKGQEEMQKAFSVKEACEMVLIRIAYATDLPDLKTLIEGSDLKKKNEIHSLNNISSSKEKDNIDSFESLLSLAKENKAMSLYTMLIDQVKLVSYKPYEVKLILVEKDNLNLLNKIKKELLLLTGSNWTLDILNDEKGYTSVTENKNNEKQKIIQRASENKLVKPFLKEFPEAKIIEVNKEVTNNLKE
ncbi:MAG: DNA polymerase III subunit gamma/tau [Pelagibacterales bacterium]|nr:DNA polymerase III subunit gamma/tau [Pelagibacterales bacterium]